MTSGLSTYALHCIFVSLAWLLIPYNVVYLLQSKERKAEFFNKYCIGLTVCCLLSSAIGFVIALIIGYIVNSLNCGDGTVDRCSDWNFKMFVYSSILIASELFQISTFITLGGLIHEFSKDIVKVNQNDN